MSYGRKFILIANVFQSMPIYLIMNPPQKIIDRLYKFFIVFFWSKVGGEKRKRWIAWEYMFFPE